MKNKSIRQEFADTMLEVGKENPNLVVMVGDISHSILKPFAKSCPSRYYNVGICEPSIVNMAAGLSKLNLIPVVHTIAPFIVERSYEQIKLDASKEKGPKIDDDEILAAASGTGFFVSRTGHIVTNYHVIAECKDIKTFYKENLKIPTGARPL